jgi:hypothetical protein
VTIPENVASIPGNPFDGCPLSFINVSASNPEFEQIDGVLFDKSGSTLITFSNMKATEYSVPYGVIEIRANAFYRCTNIRRVTLSDTVEIIGERAFLRCTGLEFISLGNSLRFIGEVAFVGCNNERFTEIFIPATIEEIQADAFYNATRLLTINLGRSRDEIILGRNWFPTNNGNTIRELVINDGR